MAHPVIIGALGPWRSAQVWLTQSSEVDDAPYTGRIVVESGSSPAAVYALPAPDETESAYLMTVRAVMFSNVDHDAARALAVLYSATRIGPRQPTEYASNVYKWSGHSLVRLPAVETKLSGAKSSADVLRRLAQMPTRSKQ